MTDEQYQILTSYLRGHSELASLTHDDLARWLNEHKINTGPGPLSIAHVLRWAAEYAVIPDLETAAAAHPAEASARHREGGSLDAAIAAGDRAAFGGRSHPGDA
ncbi:MAG: hypothetical protein KatS3mg038_2956 [Candidatus Kapaibacterium sp.]|nr:MAG: hypothetical protein KatS3mg038_2956 [Candidatus Kapabacteria bacterium]